MFFNFLFKKYKYISCFCLFLILFSSFIFLSSVFAMDNITNVNSVPVQRNYGYKFSTDWTLSDYKNNVDFPMVVFNSEVKNASNTQFGTNYQVFGVKLSDYICVGYHYSYAGTKKFDVLLYDKNTLNYVSAVNVYHQFLHEQRFYNDGSFEEFFLEGNNFPYTYFTQFIDSNIPIFDEISNVENYVKTGSYTGIINPDFLPYSFDLECPQELKAQILNAYSNDSRFLFNWKQTDETYVNWETEVLAYYDVRYRDQIFGFISTSDWEYINNLFIFDKCIPTSHLKFTCDFFSSEYDSAITSYLSSINKSHGGLQLDICGVDFYFRNKFVDESSGKVHYSSWVRVNYIPNGEKFDVSYSEIDSPSPDSVGNDGKPTGTPSTDNGYTGEIQDASLASSNLLGFIKDGFGIVGDNGVISFLKESLSFIPPEFWEIIIIGVSFFVLTSLLKFVRG